MHVYILFIYNVNFTAGKKLRYPRVNRLTPFDNVDPWKGGAVRWFLDGPH